MQIKKTTKKFNVKNGHYTVERVTQGNMYSDTVKVSNNDIRLFRYRPITDYTIDALLSDDFFASKPITFNDPYDTSIYYDIDKIKEHIRENYPQLNKDEIIQIYDEMFKMTNKDTSYIASLSTKNDSTPMWAHYANLGKGFVVEYSYIELYELAKDYYLEGVYSALDYLKITHDDFFNNNYEEEISKVPFLFPVSYQKNVLNITQYLIETMDKYFKSLKDNQEESNFNLIRTFLTKEERQKTNNFLYGTNSIKNTAWKYEEEWRIVCFTAYNTNLHTSLGKLRPKAIYMGEFITKGNEILITKIATDKNIELYKAQSKMSIKTNKLGFKKINITK